MATCLVSTAVTGECQHLTEAIPSHGVAGSRGGLGADFHPLLELTPSMMVRDFEPRRGVRSTHGLQTCIARKLYACVGHGEAAGSKNMALDPAEG